MTNGKPTGFNTRWTLLSWELPSDTRAARRDLARFHRKIGPLSRWGTKATGATLVPVSPERMAELIGDAPPDSRISIVAVTDKQMERSTTTFGPRRSAESL